MTSNFVHKVRLHLGCLYRIISNSHNMRPHCTLTLAVHYIALYLDVVSNFTVKPLLLRFPLLFYLTQLLLAMA
jgi:hypothetical protein